MRSPQMYQTLSQFFSFSLVFTAGMFYPLRAFPAWLALVGTLNLLADGVDAMRQVFLASSSARMAAAVHLFNRPVPLLDDLPIVAVSGALLLTAAIWLFTRQEREA